CRTARGAAGFDGEPGPVRGDLRHHHPLDRRAERPGHQDAAGHGAAHRRLEDRQRSGRGRAHRRRLHPEAGRRGRPGHGVRLHQRLRGRRRRVRGRCE
ncbi:hypothetical protein LTR94_030914, partial [Friedmanniomyces endolithicus]